MGILILTCRKRNSFLRHCLQTCFLFLYYTACSPLRKKSPYSEFFWCAFSSIWPEYGEILHISPYSVRRRENTDQKNSEYGDFLRSAQELNTAQKIKFSIKYFFSKCDQIRKKLKFFVQCERHLLQRNQKRK